VRRNAHIAEVNALAVNHLIYAITVKKVIIYLKKETACTHVQQVIEQIQKQEHAHTVLNTVVTVAQIINVMYVMMDIIYLMVNHAWRNARSVTFQSKAFAFHAQTNSHAEVNMESKHGPL
jgi:hypothetical protein